MAIRYLSGVNIDSNTLVVDDVNNRVGIGTASPTVALHIVTGGLTQIRLQHDSWNYWDITSAYNITNADLYFSMAGAEKFRINASGNVGIGTTSPTEKLSLSGSTATTFGLSLEPSGWNSAKHRFTVPVSGDTSMWSFNYNGSVVDSSLYATSSIQIGQGAILFSTGGTNTAPSEKMRVTSSGNVGIANSSPITKFTVGAYEGSRLPYINGTANTFNADGITVTSYNTANAGIGGGLDLTNNVYSVGSFSPLISFSSKTQSGTYNNNYAAIYGVLAGDSGDGNWNSGHLVFATALAYGASEKMRITNAGNVGIGTTSPGAKLDVRGRTNIWGAGTTSATLGLSVLDSPGSNYNFYIEDNGGAYLRGNVRIGNSTDNGYKLDVAGDINTSSGVYRIGGNTILSGTTNVAVGSAGGTGSVALRTTSGDGLVLSGSSVGIGTTSPTSKLEVFDGDISVTTSGSFSFLNLNRNFIPNSSGVLLGGIKYRGYSTGTTYQSGAYIYSYSSAAWTSTSSPGYLSIQTTPSGSTTPVERMLVASNGAIKLNAYGSGSNTGTATQRLAVDASGNVIEIPIGSGPVDGNGTANYVTKWSDADTITNSIIYDNGTNVGIGTTSPGQALTLGANKNVRLDWGGGTDTTLEMFYDSSYRMGLKFQGNDRRLTLYNYRGDGTNTDLVLKDGNLGIGTTSPSYKLDVRGNLLAVGPNGGPGIIGIWEAESIASTGGSIVSDSSASGGSAWTTNGNYQLFGPYTNLPRGNYRLSVRVKVADASYTGNAVRINAYIPSVGSAQDRYIKGIDFSANDTWEMFSIPFKITGITANNVEFYVFGLNSQNITVDYLSVTVDNDSYTAQNWGNLYVNGNVGIGTTSPSSKLHVSSSGETTLIIDSTSAGTARINLTGAGGGAGAITSTVGGLYVYASGANPITFNTNGSERLRVESNGNVGIGTTSPNAKLDVVAADNAIISVRQSNAPGASKYAQIVLTHGTTYFGANDKSYQLVSNSLGSGEADFAIQYWNGTSYNERMRITSGGNVGIGTTSPSTKLQVIGAGRVLNVSSSNDQVPASFNCSTGGVSTIGFYAVGSANDYNVRIGANVDDFVAYTSDTERLRITSGGNVGLGTTSPSSKLHVSGDTYVTGQFAQGVAVASKITAYGAEFRSSSASAQIFFGRSGDSIGSGGIGADETSTFIVWSIPSFVKLLVVNQNGNVGINTDAPSQKLHVVGSARVTGAYYDSNNSAGSSGQVLSSTGSGTDWVSLSEITGVDGTGTANYVAKWSDTDTITNSQIQDNGTTVGIGVAPAAAKLTVNGSGNIGGRYLYNNFQPYLDTTGVNVAGLSASTNGDSAFFTFEAGAGEGHYQRIVYSCYNAGGTWIVVKAIDEGNNAFDVVASASSGATITFTWKARSSTIYYTPRLVVTGVGSINTSYL